MGEQEISWTILGKVNWYKITRKKQLPYKVENMDTYDAVLSPLGKNPKDMLVHVHKEIHARMSKSINIHNTQKIEKYEMYINSRTDKNVFL